MKLEKKDLRILAKTRRNSIPNRIEKSDLIFKKLISMPVWQQSKAISCYVSFQSEVNTKQIITAALNQEKELYVPKVISKEKIELYRIYTTNELEESSFGILEPNKKIVDSKERIANHKQLSLIILPGLAFDKRGNRLGFGAGHYDRLLTKLSYDCTKIALAFREQILETIPTEPNDQVMNTIITESENFPE